MLVQQNDITTIFNRFIAAISPYLQQWADKGKDSVWVRNQSIEKRIDRELVKLQSDLLANITQFQMDAWKRSELKNDDFISRYIEGLAISTAIKEGLFVHNAKAMLQLKKVWILGEMPYLTVCGILRSWQKNNWSIILHPEYR